MDNINGVLHTYRAANIDGGNYVRAINIEAGTRIWFVDEMNYEHVANMLKCRRGFEVVCDERSRSIYFSKVPPCDYDDILF